MPVRIWSGGPKSQLVGTLSWPTDSEVADGMAAMSMLHADDVKADVRTAWEKVAPKQPDQRPAVMIPVVLGTRLSKSFRSDVRAWGFVRHVSYQQAGPEPFESGSGYRWLHFHCQSLNEATDA
jgi:hypothetical protein